MDVIVDGQPCRGCLRSDEAALHPELGCRIEIVESRNCSPGTIQQRERWMGTNAIVNFHVRSWRSTFTR